MAPNLFDFNPEDNFRNASKLKQELVSEIDIIREAMMVINMFLSEPFRAGAVMFQELEPTLTKNKSAKNEN